MTYEKVWKQHKLWLESNISYLKKQLDEDNEIDKKIIKAKHEAMSIDYYQMLETEKLYPLDEKQIVIKKNLE